MNTASSDSRLPGVDVGFLQKIGALWRARTDKAGAGSPSGGGAALSDRGLLVFEHTGQVIRAETVLRDAGFIVEVKGPPPDLRTGCDMVVVFPLVRQVAVLACLAAHNLTPLRCVTAADVLLEPVSLYHVKDFGDWLMVRAANMKITVDKATRRIVNISGGGCPDVPFLAVSLTGLTLDEAQEPRRIGQTLCCYSLQKAFEEARRLLPCG